MSEGRRLVGGLTLLAVTGGALGLSQVSHANRPYVRYYVPGKPLMLSLPSTWKPTTSSSATLPFLAYAPDTNVYAGVADGYQVQKGFAALVSYAVASQRQYYEERDPKATERHRRRDLPIGPTEEIINVIRAKATDGSEQRQEIDSYWFEVRGKPYSLSCVFPTATVVASLPVCRSVAATLRSR